jgi:thiamine pyrophosphate-dependent acetolactate synthase large subunit-like protein
MRRSNERPTRRASAVGRIPHFDLTEPAVDFVSYERLFAMTVTTGVDATRIDDPAELAPALAAGFASESPCLIDVPVAASSSA